MTTTENPEFEVLTTYTIQLRGPGPITGYERDSAGEFERYEGIAPWILRETEENINDVLPSDYRVEIKEWTDA